jgi:hypothetical protein
VVCHVKKRIHIGLKVFENRVLRRILVPRRIEITEDEKIA